MTVSASTQQLAREAEEAYAVEEYELAASKYEAAASEYRQAGDPLMAAEMSNNRSVVLIKLGKFSAALQASQGTDRLFAEAGDLRRQAIALGNQAAALEGLKQGDQALALYRQSADLLKQIGEQDMRAYILKNISMIQFRRRKYIEALAFMRMALEAQKRLSLRERILKWLLGVVFNLMGSR